MKTNIKVRHQDGRIIEILNAEIVNDKDRKCRYHEFTQSKRITDWLEETEFKGPFFIGDKEVFFSIETSDSGKRVGAFVAKM